MKNRIKVWDIYIRFYHWALAGLVLANFIVEEDEGPHEIIGYIAVGLVLVRIIWGFIGTPYARFSEFFPTPGKVKAYISELLAGRAPRTIGHNPLGSVMMLTLLALILLLGLSGWMMSTEFFWGSEFVEETHEFLAGSLLACAGLHAVAAIIDSLRHRENLIMAMIHGYKRK